ncbi:serglycin [Ictalurus furcatus]|uniref:serglycin n=1 Tax=Ictalurus furcatus TaxID=66913 RepID=UPI0023506D0C|nr:serglycin [Ictalurus furcatus]
MRFYHSLTLLTLILVYLLSDNVLGASIKGRYVHLKCKPDSKDANCVQHKGLRSNLPGSHQRLPVRAVQDINLVESSEESYEREDSGDGSGDFLPFKLSRKERQSGPEEPIQNEEEGSSVEFEKYNDIATEPGKPKLPVEDLRKDNIIE